MYSLEPEIRELREEGSLSREAARRLIALERRDVWSLYWELRAITFAGIALLVSAVTVYLYRSGGEAAHLAAVVLIALTSAACYYWYFRRPHGSRPDAAEQILVLGSLLLAVDLAYVEVRYQLLGAEWSLHLLVVAAVNALVAYRGRSRAVLVLAMTALASWIGVDRYGIFLGESMPSLRAIAAGAVFFLWKLLHERFTPASWPQRDRFSTILEHASIILLALGGLVALTDETVMLGLILVPAVIAWSVYRYRATRQVIFPIYVTLTGSIAVMILVGRLVDIAELVFFLNLVVAIVAMVILFVIIWRARR